MTKEDVKKVIAKLEEAVDGLPYFAKHPILKGVWDAIKAAVLSDAVIDEVWARINAAK